MYPSAVSEKLLPATNKMVAKVASLKTWIFESCVEIKHAKKKKIQNWQQDKLLKYYRQSFFCLDFQCIASPL